MDLLGTTRAGHALRPAGHGRQSAVHRHGRAVPGPGHRRQHRHLQLHGCHSAALPARHPPRATGSPQLARQRRAGDSRSNGTRHGDGTGATTSPNYPFGAFQLLRSNQDTLSTLFAYATAWEINLVAENQAEVADGQLVSGGFYSGLGVSPAAGRLIADDDDRSGAAPVAVLSYSTGRAATPPAPPPSDARS